MEETLYNKYRPNTFEELVGQESTVALLKEQIHSGDVPHSLIFHGPSGTGKTSCARLLAKQLNPSKYGIFEKDSAEDGAKDNIKQIINDVINAPMEGSYKTYIFDEAHLITAAAWGSLLKITEEPPRHVKFIFVTTNLSKIPDTIRSRSQVYFFNRLSNSEIIDRLNGIVKNEGEEVPNDVLSTIAGYSLGSLRAAIGGLDMVLSALHSGQKEAIVEKLLGVISSGTFLNVIKGFFKKDFKALFSALQKFNEDTCDLEKAVYSYQQYLMDLRIALVYKEAERDLRSDVLSGLNFLKSHIKENSSENIKSIGTSLDALYDDSLTLENDLRRTSNKSAAINRYCIRLVQLFKAS